MFPNPVGEVNISPMCNSRKNEKKCFLFWYNVKNNYLCEVFWQTALKKKEKT